MLGVSDDTVRRWIEQGRLHARRDVSGRQVVEGVHLAEFARAQAEHSPLAHLDATSGQRSIRNHFTGIVTRVTKDLVMSQVDVQCGPFRVVSLVSTESVDELGIDVGSLVTAVAKATNVSLQIGDRA